MKLQEMQGYKLYKSIENTDDIEIIRIVRVRKGKQDPEEVLIQLEDGTRKMISTKELKEYTPLAPDAFLMFNVVSMHEDNEKFSDVVVTASKVLEMAFGMKMPFAICRQCAIDPYSQLASTGDTIFGVSMNQNDAPKGFDFRELLVADSIDYYDHFNYYRTDTLDDILDMIDTKKYDQALTNTYIKFCRSTDPTAAFKKSDHGWCKTLSVLLEQNTFQSDIDELLGITAVDFEVDKFLDSKELPANPDIKYDYCREDLKLWLSEIFKVKIGDTTVLEFGPDINLGDFNDNTYFLLRDKNKRIWLVVYTIAGEFFEDDLKKELSTVNISDQLRLDFHNKYKNNK